MIVFEVFFWFSVGFVVASTLGYPVMIAVLSLFVKKAKVFSKDEPIVSLIIAAHNEEKVIREKIGSSLYYSVLMGKKEEQSAVSL